ncbi:MAG TPA: CpsD/CapB family tyrosine-protein kinase [Tepidisphaeraceae bacterium]
MLPLLVRANDPAAELADDLLVASPSPGVIELQIDSPYPADAGRFLAAVFESAQEILINPDATALARMMPLERATLDALAGFRLTPVRELSRSEALGLDPRTGLLLSLWAGLVLGLVFAKIHRIIRPQVRSPEQLERMVPVVVVGHIPQLPRNTSPAMKCFVAHVDPLGAAGVACRSLVARVSSELRGNCLLVTAVMPAAGRTTVAVQIATAFALADHRTLLVDADVFAPSLHKVFDVAQSSGFCDSMLKPELVETLIRPSHIEGLDVLTAGRPSLNSLPQMQGPRLPEMLRTLKSRYAHVIIDAPLWGSGPEVESLVKACDRTVLVVRADEPAPALLSECAKQIRQLTSTTALAAVNALPYDGRESRFGVIPPPVATARSGLLERDEVHAYGFVRDSNN